MCFFKKKKRHLVYGNKFYKGELVNFRRKNQIEQDFGWIYDIHQDDNGKITYDIQIGGQCPAIVYDVDEDIIKVKL